MKKREKQDIDERRDSYRLTVKDNTAFIEGPSGGPGLKLEDLSASGGGLLVQSGATFAGDEVRARVTLIDEPPFEVRLRPTRIFDKGNVTKLGVRLEVDGLAPLRTMSRYLTGLFLEQEHALARLVDHPSPIRAEVMRHSLRKVLLYYGIACRRKMKVFMGDLELPCQAMLRGIVVRAARELMAIELTGEQEVFENGRDYFMAMPAANCLLLFNTRFWKREGPVFLFTLPEKLQRTGLRRSLRLPVGEKGRVKVSFPHPRLQGRLVVHEAREISGDGLAFPIDLDKDILFPGEKISNVRIEHPMGVSIGETMVRSIDRDEKTYSCGLEILNFQNQAQAETWKRFVFQELHPGLKLGGIEDVDSAWTALKASGYLEEVTQDLVPLLKKRFMVSWTRQSNNTPVARYMLYFHQDDPGATLAANLLYPGTWIVHHLGVAKAIRKKSRKDMLEIARKLYSGNAYLLEHLADSEFFVIYVNAAKAWNEMMYGRFLRQYKQPLDFVYDGYKVYKCITEKSLQKSGKWRKSISVREANFEMLDLLSEHLKLQLPELEYDAFCYHREQIDLKDFSRWCLDLGYERSRKIFVARENGDLRAGLIAECGDQGLNVFSLFNRCWFVYPDDEARHDEEIKGALLERAVAYYTKQEKSEFMLLGSFAGEPDNVLKSLGFKYVTDVIRWLARRDILPSYLEYIQEFLGMMHG
ncbi:MAG: hypothetical protein GXP49_07160 [Deltaproteobacteria bacterium]|nr:hypothetical protein [Deltaproteobacteria bacterium]